MPSSIVANTLQSIISEINVNLNNLKNEGIYLKKYLEEKSHCSIPVSKIKDFHEWLLHNAPEVASRYDRFFTDYTANALWIKVKSITESYNQTYDFTVPGSHSFLQNGMMGSNTGGDCIITSTPNTDEDKFAQIWFNAVPASLSDKWEDKLAKRYSNERPEDKEVYSTIFETDEVKEDFENQSLNFLDDDEDEEDDGFVSFHAHWTRVPAKLHPDGTVAEYRGEKFKRAEMKSNLTEELWMREYECCFIGSQSTLISGSKIASLRSTVRDPRFIDKWGMRWYENILPNTAYAVVMDPSGDGVGDDAAIQVWEIPYLKQVAEWNNAEADQNEQARMLKRTLSRINAIQENNPDHNGQTDIYYSVERNAIGIGIVRAIEHLGEENFPGWFIDASEISLSVRAESSMPPSITKYRGLITTVSSKRRYCQEFKQLIERNLLIVRSKFLASQMKTFVKSGSGWGAKEGTKDDIIMSAILQCHLIDEIRAIEPDLDDYVRPILEEEADPDDLTHPDNQALIPMI